MWDVFDGTPLLAGKLDMYTYVCICTYTVGKYILIVPLHYIASLTNMPVST